MLQPLARACRPGSTQSGALTESGESSCPSIPLPALGPYPLLLAPFCSCSSPRDIVPTPPQDPLGPADPETGGYPFSLPHLP